MATGMVAAPAANNQNNYITGLDQVLKLNPVDSRHRYRWNQNVPSASEWKRHFPTSAGHDSSDLVFEAYNYMDQIHTLYLLFARPGIKGVKAPNTQTYVTEKNCRLRRADRKAAELYYTEEGEEDDEDEDEDLSRAARGLRDFAARTGGNAGLRTYGDMEDAETVDTEDTADPAKQKYYAYYISAWVYEACRNFMAVVGTLVFDGILGRYMFLYHDTSVRESKKVGLRDMTGQEPAGEWHDVERRNILIEKSAEDDEMWLPIPLWCTLIPEMSMNIFAWEWSPVQYHVKIAGFQAFVKRANKKTQVVKANGKPLTDSDLKVSLVQHAMHIDPMERETISKDPFDALIIQHHARKQVKDLENINIKFHQPTIAIRIAVQRKAAMRALKPNWYWGLFERAPIVDMAIYFNTQLRQEEMPEKFYRLIQAWEKCTATPRACQYLFGFAFDIESPYPDGSVNMIRYSKVTAATRMQKFLDKEEVTAWVFQTNWMLIKTEKEIVVPAFNNQSRTAL